MRFKVHAEPFGRERTFHKPLNRLGGVSYLLGDGPHGGVRAEARIGFRKNACGPVEEFLHCAELAMQFCLAHTGNSLLADFRFRCGNVLFIRTLEILDVSMVEVPDAGGYFVNYVVIVSH